MFQSVGSLHHNMNSSESSVQEFPYGFQSQQGSNIQSFLTKETEFPFKINPHLDGFVEQTPQVINNRYERDLSYSESLKMFSCLCQILLKCITFEDSVTHFQKVRAT